MASSFEQLVSAIAPIAARKNRFFFISEKFKKVNK
jgi:hypothetical protein